MFEAVVVAAVMGVAQVTDVPSSPEEEHTDYFRVQLNVEAGLPDGFGLGLSIAPVPHVRLSVAGLTNVIGFGVRGGLAVVPFASWTVHPILSLDVGRYFGPDVFHYDFVDATAGFELAFRVVVFRVTAGASRVAAVFDENEIDTVIPSAKLALAFKLN